MFALRLLLLLLATTAFGAETLTPRGAVLRLAVTGDTGDGAEAVAKGIARVHTTSPLDAILLIGDNFYPCGVTSERDPRWSVNLPLTRIGIPLSPVLGNHDFCGKSDPEAQIRATGTIPNWHFPARQYALRTPFADFAFVDTTLFVKAAPTKSRPPSRKSLPARRSPGASWSAITRSSPRATTATFHGTRWRGCAASSPTARRRTSTSSSRATTTTWS
jgi:hypothetical protein